MSQTVSGRDPHTGKPLLVSFAQGHITAVSEGVTSQTAWLTSGLIDLQVNGYRGHDFNADNLTIEAVQSIANSLLAAGVTTFQPTIITAAEEKIIQNLRIVAAARKTDPMLAHLISSVHIEGPHIASEDGPRGAHPPEHVRPPEVAEYMRWQAASRGLVGMVTLSPHFAGACEYIYALSQQGTYVSLGHTGATAEQIHAAAAAGARLSTHLGNGVAGTLARHPILIWAQLAEDRLTATFIADGHHLPLDTLKVMLRAKTATRAILISDLVALAGNPPGSYQTPVGGKVELLADGRLNLAGTDLLAGAACTLKDAVAFVASNTDLGLGNSVRMATENPGRFVGRRGAIRVGNPADLIRFRWEEGSNSLAIEEVIVQGQRWTIAGSR